MNPPRPTVIVVKRFRGPTHLLGERNIGHPQKFYHGSKVFYIMSKGAHLARAASAFVPPGFFGLEVLELCILVV